MLDLVIVGGGPAGISTALHVLAADPRVRLAVLEKERYPREKICAGAVGGRAFRLLERLGVEVDCPRVRLDAIAMRVGGQTVVVPEPGCGAVVRRIEFDHAFAQVAQARGVDVRDGCEVSRITVGDGGVELETAGGTLRARAVIGADGVGGVVRRQAGFPRGELRAQVAELDTEDVPGDLPRDTAVFDFAATDLRGYAWDFPTQVGGRALVCRGVYLLRTPAAAAQAAAAQAQEAAAQTQEAASAPAPAPGVRDRIAAYLGARGLELSRYRLKQFAERGFEPGAEIAKPRVLLVGEAAGIDIATGEGIGQAIEYGAVAGPYLARALARDDLGFADWRRAVERHHLGWQLGIRHGCYRAFYGRRRPKIERLMPRMPSLFRLAVQDFAGVPLSKLAMVRGAAQFLAAFTRAKLA
ncbi:MAG TPA: NAD(P)/FAD-dependent oxidoreductase [Kofleriaceae bacterium]|nr:NAD(P)/FAD-dependent oxidoreductase [Kofleriaceae bacterium]